MTYRFRSDNLWTDPGPVLPPGSEIRVYVHPDDYSKYYVDAKSYIEGKIMDFT